MGIFGLMAIGKSAQRINYIRKIFDQGRMVYINYIIYKEISIPVIEINRGRYLDHTDGFIQLFFYGGYIQTPDLACRVQRNFAAAAIVNSVFSKNAGTAIILQDNISNKAVVLDIKSF